MLVRWRGHGFRVTSHVCTLAPPLESRMTWQRSFWPQSLFPLLQNWSNNSKLTESWAFRSRIRKTCSLTPGPQQVPRASEFPFSRLQSVSHAAPLRRLAWEGGEWLVGISLELKLELNNANKRFITFQKFYYQVHLQMGKPKSERCIDLPKVTQLAVCDFISFCLLSSSQLPEVKKEPMEGGCLSCNL